MKLFGTSGIRLKANEYLLQLGLKVGLVTGRRYKRIITGCDSRTSSPSLKNALIAGLCGAGACVHDAGIITSPALAYAARYFDAGVMVTASHNPADYNGFKLFNPDGFAFDYSQQKEIEEKILNNKLSSAPWQEISSPEPYPQAIEQHVNHILKNFPEKYDVKIVLDCGGGAGSVETPVLLRMLGCDVIELNCEPRGVFPRPPEPVEANLGELIKKVLQHKADLGLAHDGDADRLVAVDDKGRYIDGDILMVMLARSINASSVVTTLDASMLIEEEKSFSIKRTPIGDNHVSSALKSWGDFGGEPSGSWIFPHVSYCPDGIFAAAQMASLASKQNISHAVDSFPRYPIIRGSVDSKGREFNPIKAQLMNMEAESFIDIDGIKMFFKDARLLVRASGTEPKIRITAEAKTKENARALYNESVDIINNALNESGVNS